MATFLITFIPHFEPEVQNFSTDDFKARPTRLLAAALKEWMFKNKNAPDEIIAVGVKSSQWQLLTEFAAQKPVELKELRSKQNDSEEDFETFVTAVGQACGVQIHVHAHDENDDDSAIFERAILRLNPLDEVVIDTTHGPVGLWMAFALLEKEHHLHEVVFQGFYGGRLGPKDTRFAAAKAPGSTRAHLALLDLTIRLQTQPLRNYAKSIPEFSQLESRLDDFDNAVRRASPRDFREILQSLTMWFSRLEESEDARTASLGRRGHKMMKALAEGQWDFHVLNAMWKRTDPLLFSRWAILCMTNLSMIRHPFYGHSPEPWERARKSLCQGDTTLAQWVFDNAAPLSAADITHAQEIIKRFQLQENPAALEEDIIWMTSFVIRFPIAFQHVTQVLEPPRLGLGGVRLQAILDQGEHLDEPEVLRMMADVCELQIPVHDRGFVFGLIGPSQILRVNNSKTKTARYVPRWVASPQIRMKLTRVSPYMSPEEVRGFGLTPASDIASLGLVALSCLQKSPVFGHPHEFELLEQIRRWKVPDWSAVPMSPFLRSVLTKCLQKDPSERFRDARSLYESLLNELPELATV